MIRILIAALWLLLGTAAQSEPGTLWLAQEKLRPFRVAPAPDFQPGVRSPMDSAGRWTRLALEMVVKYQQNPLRAARALAILHAAMNDAAVTAARESAPEMASPARSVTYAASTSTPSPPPRNGAW